MYDKRDSQLPNVGLIRIKDLETHEERWLDTSSSKVRQAHSKWWYERQITMNTTMQRCRVDVASIATDENYVKALMALFQKRGVR